MLPCDPKNFSKFISSLLGKPQTISKIYVGGSFEVNHAEIESVFHLVNQRVKQQNRASLIQFRVKLIFNDDSSILLNSFSDFKIYSEVKPIIVTQVHLSWSFLVQFEDRTYPEQQNIDLSFVTNGANKLSIFDTEDLPVFHTSLSNAGYISLRIEHTARTWGTDIESLLSGYIRNLLLPEGKVRSFIRKHNGKVSTFFGFSFFISSIAACFYSASEIEKKRLEAIKPIISDTIHLDHKLNTLLDMVASGYWGTFFFSVFVFTIFSLMFATFFGIWIASATDTRPPSYLLLTRKSEQYKLKNDLKYRNKFISFLLSIATGIATGIIGNIIFTYCWMNP